MPDPLLVLGHILDRYTRTSDIECFMSRHLSYVEIVD